VESCCRWKPESTSQDCSAGDDDDDGCLLRMEMKCSDRELEIEMLPGM
jgi:hypothetical protein